MTKDRIEIDIKPEDFFQALSDTTRLRCVFLIHEKGESCVCALASVLGLSQPKISRHLAILRQYGIVDSQRSGLWVYYRINKNLSTFANKILKTTCNTLKNNAPYVDFLASLSSLNEAACKLAPLAQNDENTILSNTLAGKEDRKTYFKATG